MQMARMPNAYAEWDINGMLAYTMKMQGERNIDRFKIKVGSPEYIQRQAQAGNIVPIGGAGGKGKPGGSAAGTGTAGGA